MIDHDLFISCIHEKRILKITFRSVKGEIKTRLCAPLDYGFKTTNGKRELPHKYHFWDFDSPDKPHFLSILPKDLLSIAKTDDVFIPSNIVPKKFITNIPRDW